MFGRLTNWGAMYFFGIRRAYGIRPGSAAALGRFRLAQHMRYLVLVATTLIAIGVMLIVPPQVHTASELVIVVLAGLGWFVIETLLGNLTDRVILLEYIRSGEAKPVHSTVAMVRRIEDPWWCLFCPRARPTLWYELQEAFDEGRESFRRACERYNLTPPA